VSTPPDPEPLSDYLDVLLLGSAPVDAAPALNLAQEIANFENEVRRSPIPIRLRRVFPPTLEQLKRELSPTALRFRRPRVFHFVGHGDEDGLWFEEEDGSKVLIKNTTLGKVLQNTSVDLALINACWSATDRLISLCDSLVRENCVRAAIGHARPVADKSAIVFAKQLHAHLTQGAPAGRACQLAANALPALGLAGSTKVQFRGDAALRLDDRLRPGERPGRIEDGTPSRGRLPGAGFFCGRAEEYLAISRTLDDASQCAYGIWGMGGIGKTALALEIALRNAWRYVQGGVVFVDARDLVRATTHALLQRALARLIPGSASDDPAYELQFQLKAAPGLLVFDNLETLADTEYPALARFIRGIPRNGSRVVLTARAPITDVEKLPDSKSTLLTTGLDDSNGAEYVHRIALAKEIQALYDEPRIEQGRVAGVCARVSRRLSGHPKMIEIAVPLARTSTEALNAALDGLTGDLEAQFDELLTTGLHLLGEEGHRLFAHLSFFPTGRFMPEAMHAVYVAIAISKMMADLSDEDMDQGNASLWVEFGLQQLDRDGVDTGLRQLERAGFLSFDQDVIVYSFHQTLLERAARETLLSDHEKATGWGSLHAFYADYIAENHQNFPAIDRCFEDAILLMERFWEGREEAGLVDAVVARMTSALGSYLHQRGHWQLADRWSERAIQLRQESWAAKNDRALSHEYHRRAVLLSDLGDPVEARRMLHESMAIDESFGDRRGMSAAMHQLASTESARGNLSEARRLLRESMAIDESLGDRRGMSVAMRELANIERTQGNPSEARRLLLESLAITESLGDRLRLSSSMHQLAMIESELGNPSEARRLLRESRAMAESLGDRPGLAAAMHQTAVFEREQGSPTEARRLLRESLAISESLGDRRSLAASMHVLAMIESDQGNPSEAGRLLRESMAILDSLGDRRGMSSSMNQLAFVERAQGNPSESRRLLRESLAIKELLGDRRGMSSSMHHLALTENELGNPNEARRLLRESQAILESSGDRGAMSASMHHLAMIESEQGNPNEARRLLRESMSIDESLRDQRGMSASMHVLAIIESAQGNIVEARRLWDESLEIKERLGDLEGYAATLLMRAQAEAGDGNYETALQHGREGVRRLEQIRSAMLGKAREILEGIEGMADAMVHPRAVEFRALVERFAALPTERVQADMDDYLRDARNSGQSAGELLVVFLARSMMDWRAGQVAELDVDLRSAAELLSDVEDGDRAALSQLLETLKAGRASAGENSLPESVRPHNEATRALEVCDDEVSPR
jgi:tetratricopeptide (TPR) repeat protein